MESLINLQVKYGFPRQGVFSHLLSLNSVVYFKNTKLDVDLGYVSNDRSEFEDSDVAGLQMKLNTFNYNAKYHLPKVGALNQLLWRARNASNQCEREKNTLFRCYDQ
jgi:hypothetical protein